jgi:hypothetical protein
VYLIGGKTVRPAKSRREPAASRRLYRLLTVNLRECGDKGSPGGNDPCVTAAEMTDALAQINDRLADAARGSGSRSETLTFFCECGDCMAEEVPLSLDEHEELRIREDLIFAPGHDAPRRYREPKLLGWDSLPRYAELRIGDSERWRVALLYALTRSAFLPRLDRRFS